MSADEEHARKLGLELEGRLQHQLDRLPFAILPSRELGAGMGIESGCRTWFEYDPTTATLTLSAVLTIKVFRAENDETPATAGGPGPS